MKVAIIAPPWLKTYKGCYYGIEVFIHNLVKALYEKSEHEIVLFTIKGTTTPADKKYWYHQSEQYKHIHRRWYEAVPVISSHLLYSLNVIRNSGDFDLIHDNNSFMGPAMMAFAGINLPPVLHTLHEPMTDAHLLRSGIPDNQTMFEELRHAKRMYFNGVSDSQLQSVPDGLKSQILGAVHNGVDLDDYGFSDQKENYFLCVGRVSSQKGQATAAKLCDELNLPLKIAGTVGASIKTRERLLRELDDPSIDVIDDPDYLYYKEQILPHTAAKDIQYVGTVFGQGKVDLFCKAKAFLMPITWDEPFGLAVIDALACGTPVVAMNRGAMPEIIEHGVNGFLAENEAEFKNYMQRVGEIDPHACKKSVEDKFSASAMADQYLELYRQVIERSS